MRPVPWLFPAVLLLCGAAGAADLKAAREALELPSAQSSVLGRLVLGFALSSDAAATAGVLDPEAEASALRRELKGDASDAPRCLRLSELYGFLKDERAAEVLDEAIRLYREALAKQPSDPSLLSGLGRALVRKEVEREEAERLLRRALRLEPKDWRAWIALAQVVKGRAVRAFLGSVLPPKARMELGELMQRVRDSRLSSADISTAEELLDEARGCMDRAIAAAPDRSEPYVHRALYRALEEGMLTSLIRAARGEPGPERPLFLGSDALADVRQAALLSPRNSRLQGMALVLGTLPEMAAGPRQPTDGAPWGALSAALQSECRGTMTRLEALAKDRDRLVAAGALATLGVLRLALMQDLEGGEDALRRARRLDRRQGRTMEAMLGAWAQAGRWADLRRLARECVRNDGSARSHLALAQAHSKLERWEEGEKAVRAGLRRFPRDAGLNLAMAVILLREGVGGAGAEARASLEAAAAGLSAEEPEVSAAGLSAEEPEVSAAGLSAEEPEVSAAEYHTARAVYLASEGEMPAALSELRQALEAQSGYGPAERVLAAVTKPQ